MSLNENVDWVSVVRSVWALVFGTNMALLRAHALYHAAVLKAPLLIHTWAVEMQVLS